MRRPPKSPVFPYTTLFRSLVARRFGESAYQSDFSVGGQGEQPGLVFQQHGALGGGLDRKSTRLNSSHVKISYAVYCLKKKIKEKSGNSHVSKLVMRITALV